MNIYEYKINKDTLKISIMKYPIYTEKQVDIDDFRKSCGSRTVFVYNDEPPYTLDEDTIEDLECWLYARDIGKVEDHAEDYYIYTLDPITVDEIKSKVRNFHLDIKHDLESRLEDIRIKINDCLGIH